MTKIANNSVLLIIDIQKKYTMNFNIDYLEQVHDFISKHPFKEIRCVLDVFPENRGDLVPTFINNLCTDKPLFKQYSTGFYQFQMIVNGFFNKYPELKTFENMKNNNEEGCFKIKKSMVFRIPSPLQDTSYLQYMTHDFVENLERWKNNNNKVYIIGGGLTRCVWTTKRILEIYGIEVEVIPEVCYSISENKIFNNLNEGANKLIENYNQALLTPSKTALSWSIVKNTDPEIEYFFICNKN